MNQLEHATQFSRRNLTRFAGAVAKALSLRPPCARCKRATATRVVTDGDAPQAVCRDCGENARLDAQVKAQRERREAMRRRA